MINAQRRCAPTTGCFRSDRWMLRVGITVGIRRNTQGRIFPELRQIRRVSAAIAPDVPDVAFRRGLTKMARPDDVLAYLESEMYEPDYPVYVYRRDWLPLSPALTFWECQLYRAHLAQPLKGTDGTLRVAPRVAFPAAAGPSIMDVKASVSSA